MIEYKEMLTGNGEQVVCACCKFPAPLSEFEKGMQLKKVLLCEVCASTPIGNSHMYPSNYREDGPILQTIGHVSNMILDRISKLEKQQEEIRIAVAINT